MHSAQKSRRNPFLIKTAFLGLLAILCTFIPSLGQTFEGTWEGYLTQHIWGSVEESPYRLELSERGGKLIGTARIEASEFLSIKATMSVEGRKFGNTLVFQEQEILEGDVLGEGVGWCIKRVKVRPQKQEDGTWALVGEWEGQEPNGKECLPGKVFLKKAFPGVTLTVYDSLSYEAIDPELRVVFNTEQVVPSKSTEKGVFEFLPEEAEGTHLLMLTKKGYYDYNYRLKNAVPNQKISFGMMPIKEGDVTIIDNVNFQQGKYRLTPESLPRLDKLADFLKRNPSVVIEVLGHTSAQGDPKLNYQLSKSRAMEVCKYLNYKGVIRKRLLPRGVGSEQPIAPNNTEEGRTKNRRVEFRIVRAE